MRPLSLATAVNRSPVAVITHHHYLHGPGNRRLMTFDAQTTERVVTLRDLNGQPLRELSVTDWGPNAHWQHTHDYLSGPEGLFGRRAAGGIRRYLHRDHLGSLRLLSSGSPFNAIETGEHHYYPFGTSAFSSGNDATKSKYTGHERAPHGFADYMMGRTCAFTYQRFTSVDPGRDGWNLYAYVGNDPVGFVDPSGNERAQIWLDQDVDRLLDGEITREEYHRNLQARGSGALAVTSLFVPGPEDVLIAGLAARFGGRLLGGARRLSARLFGKVDNAEEVSKGALNLTDGQVSNLARFNKKLPNGSTGTQVDELGDGVMFTAEIPGRVPGSKAVYQKAVDADGLTTSFTKTTFDPEGNIVHIKDKLTGY